MKEKLKNYALVALAGLSAFFMRGGCSGDQPAVIPGNSIEIYLDTVMQYVSGPVQVVVRYDTVIERVIIRDPAPVDTPVLILYTTDLDPDREMTIYEGEVTGDSSRCTYRYQVGVSGDSLGFLAIESRCEHASEVFEVTPPPLSDFLPSSMGASTRLMIGTKVGWSEKNKLQYGVHGVWQSVYGSANYAPTPKAWIFEVGALIPLGAKSKEPVPITPDMN